MPRRLTVVSGGRPDPRYALIRDWDGPHEAAGDAAVEDGTLTISFTGEAAQIAGWQQAWTGVSVPLTELYPDWDDAQDELDLIQEMAVFTLTSAKYGMWNGLIDRPYASRASANGIGTFVFPNSASITQCGQFGATAPALAVNNGTNIDLVTQLRSVYSWDATGIPRATLAVRRTVAEVVQASVAGTPPTAMGVAANRRVVLAHMRNSTTAGDALISARLYHRRIRTRPGRRIFPSASLRGANPGVIVVMGHSIANGVGDTVGSAVAIPATVTVFDAGSELTAWPDNNGSGPDPGFLPAIAASLATAGGGTIIRRATSGQILAGIETTEIQRVVSDCLAQGIDRNDVGAVFLHIGENDAQNSTESTAYAARSAQTAELVEAAFPNAVLVKQEMVAQTGSYAEAPAILAGDQLMIALKGNRVLSVRTGVALNDDVHPNTAGYAVMATNLWVAYQSIAG